MKKSALGVDMHALSLYIVRRAFLTALALGRKPSSDKPHASSGKKLLSKWCVWSIADSDRTSKLAAVDFASHETSKRCVNKTKSINSV